MSGPEEAPAPPAGLRELLPLLGPHRRALAGAAGSSLAAAAVDRALLVVAHRLSTVPGSDQIVVLDGGVVTAVGSHAELLDASPLYRELAEAQLLA